MAEAGKFWESVGILPVEIVVPEGAGVTLRCYVEDVARFLGRNGEVFVFDTPADLARFCKGNEDHDLMEIASWAEVADTDVPPLPADQDRYDLTELSEVLGEVADGAAGLVDHRAFAQPVEGVRDLAEYAGLTRVEELLSPTVAAGPGGRPRRERSQRDAARPRTPQSCARCGTSSSPSSAALSSSATNRGLSVPKSRRRSGRPRDIPGPAASSFRCSAGVARRTAGPTAAHAGPGRRTTAHPRTALAVRPLARGGRSPAGRGLSPNERRGPPR